MSLTDFGLEILVAGAEVKVTAKTGAVEATWTLMIDNEVAEERLGTGRFTLSGELPDGSPLRVDVAQSILGPAEVAVFRGDDLVRKATTFVA